LVHRRRLLGTVQDEHLMVTTLADSRRDDPAWLTGGGGL
jgi:hypothetical protein